jgi:hypothetical protein
MTGAGLSQIYSLSTERLFLAAGHRLWWGGNGAVLDVDAVVEWHRHRLRPRGAEPQRTATIYHQQPAAIIVPYVGMSQGCQHWDAVGAYTGEKAHPSIVLHPFLTPQLNDLKLHHCPHLAPQGFYTTGVTRRPRPSFGDLSFARLAQGPSYGPYSVAKATAWTATFRPVVQSSCVIRDKGDDAVH